MTLLITASLLPTALTAGSVQAADCAAGRGERFDRRRDHRP